MNYNLARSIAISKYQADYIITGDHEMSLIKAVELAVGAIPNVNPEELLIDLRGSLNVSIGESRILVDKDHKPWLSENKTQINWKHWNRYRRYLLEAKHWALPVVESIDRTTDEILDRLENPMEKDRSFDVRGLVVGYVQSGKTANYTALINKAVDAGYKLIIVLAGMHDNLRCQTQTRLDAEVLGFETSTERSEIKTGKPIGVRLLTGEQTTPDIAALTSRDQRGDFKIAVGRSIRVQPTHQPFILVIKKNASILKNVLKYFRNDSPLAEEKQGKKVVPNIPLLMIDDEADQASINTNDIRDEDGNIDPDYDPTSINRRIREILNTFEQRAYVAYTATPFANILIHNEAEHREYGEDLFPRSFIVNLPKPSNYSGPSEIFGSKEEGSQGQPLIREVSDEELLIPWARRGQKDFEPQVLTDSLKEAIHAFILAIAVRRSRGEYNEHNSMLIHVTRFNMVQEKVTELVRDEIAHIKRQIRYGSGHEQSKIKSELKKLWQVDFVPTTQKMNNSADNWEDVEQELLAAVESIKIKTINGSAGDVLDYADHPNGLNVIAVGGNKLSRGLTLDGLTVSYYLRASQMYDTLMQMGRWFGYRTGYEDVCRIYTTPQLVEWFRHIAEATDELREEFDAMVADSLTPADFGLKVKSHPAMIVTSHAKMRNGEKLSLSFAGTMNETTVLDLSEEILDINFSVTENFIRSLANSFERLGEKGHIIWRNRKGIEVVDFLKEYRTAETAVRANSKILASYVEKQILRNELDDWTVVLISVKTETGSGKERIGQFDVHLSKRSFRNNIIKDTINIGKLITEDHQLMDLSQEDIESLEARGYTTHTLKRKHKSPNKGLLLIYPIKITEPDDPRFDILPYTKTRVNNINQTIIAIGVVFPGSENVEHVEYIVNNVFMENDDYEL